MFRMSSKSKGTIKSFVTSLGMAFRTLGTCSYRLRWTFYGKHVSYHGRCIFKMARSTCNELHYCLQNNRCVKANICPVWSVKQIISDNGRIFTSEEFQTFVRNNGIIHKTSAPWHPATQGLVERFVQTFKLAVKSASADGGSLHQKIGSFLLQYRNAVHATTNEGPTKPFLGRQLRSRLDLIKPNIQWRLNLRLHKVHLLCTWGARHL